MSHNQSIKHPLQMLIRLIIGVRAEKLQETLSELIKEFIWINRTLKEEPKSNQVFEGIRVIKDVQKSINMIMVVDGNNPHDFGYQSTRKSKKICALNWIHNSCTIKDLFWGVSALLIV